MVRFAASAAGTHAARVTARGKHRVYFEDGDGASLLAAAQPQLQFAPADAEGLVSLMLGDFLELFLFCAV